MSSTRTRVHARRGAAAAAVIALWAAALLAVAGPASAHDALISTTPVAGSTNPTAPGTISLTFSQGLQAEFSTMALTIGEHDAVELATVVSGSTLSGTVPAAPAGGLTPQLVRWKVGYRVVSSDGHPVSGLVEFLVGTGELLPSPSPSASGAVTGSGSGLGAGVALGGGAVLAILALGVIAVLGRGKR